MAKKMLVIDDESLVLESCRRIFGEQDFEVVTSENPREALDLVGSSHFDVVLCDWKMPGMDGVDVVEVLDKRSPGTAIVMISGYPSVDRATEVMKRGAMDYVPKPFTPERRCPVAARPRCRYPTTRRSDPAGRCRRSGRPCSRRTPRRRC